MGTQNSNCKECNHGHNDHKNGWNYHPKQYVICQDCKHSIEYTDTIKRFKICKFITKKEYRAILSTDVASDIKEEVIFHYCGCSHDDHNKKPIIDMSKGCESNCKVCKCDNCAKK